MTRPRGDADRKLIAAALDMIPETGLSGLSVRRVAARAHVNLGMFHYHFGNKKAFTRRVLGELYETFFSRLTGAIEDAQGASPRDRLRAAILAGARFAREHRPLLLALVRDLLAGDEEVIAFVRTNFPRHIAVLVRLFHEAQRAGQIRRMHVVKALPMLFAAVIGPVVAVSVVDRVLPPGFRLIPRAMLNPLLASDAAIEERLDFLLDSLAPKGKAA